MAWGNFLAIPCPRKIWNGEYKNLMLAMLPSVGLVHGAIVALLFGIMVITVFPVYITGFIVTLAVFGLCGFIHLDGFMDCCDAILSRRPLEERQRILKDPNTGAFAVVSVIFLILCWFACAVDLTEAVLLSAMKEILSGGGSLFGVSPGESAAAALLLIPVFSRGMGGLFVLTYDPIGHSQYVEDAARDDRGSCRTVIAIQLSLYTAIIAIIWLFTCGGVPLTALGAAVMTALGAYAGCAYARKQLGGMSGDIAGYSICMGEAAGLLSFIAMIHLVF